jgi:hypothetical protein
MPRETPPGDRCEKGGPLSRREREPLVRPKARDLVLARRPGSLDVLLGFRYDARIDRDSFFAEFR